ncbi:MAG TPA: hypothetical protein PKE55_00690 [Kiritimatiellia bacterium]|nr:hypothetical protein [Kiritimatiellia bacterium]
MTFRAVILGLLGVAFVNSYTYFNDWIMRQTMFVGNFMPISVYGLLVIFLAFLYPLLSKISRALLLRRSELAVILVLVLASCAIPGSNLLRLFTPALVMPHRFEKTEPGWQNQRIMDLVPDGAFSIGAGKTVPYSMLVDVSRDEELVLSGFTRGLSEASDRLAFSEVPWDAWQPALIFWLPIILSLWIALVCLALVVHRQWADHEHLPYPIVTFTKSLLPEENGDRGPILSSKLFWLALGAVFAIHGYNYLNLWFSNYLFGQIPLGIDFSSLSNLSDTFEKGGGRQLLEKFTLYFTVVAVAYFLPKEVSLSLGIGPFIWIFIAGMFATYGVGVGGWQGSWPFGLTMDAMMIMGAYFGMLVVLLYTGRQYYSAVFRRAFGIPSREPVESSAIWGARFFMIGMAFFTVYSALVAGLDWPIALLFGLGLVAVYLVMARLLAETGLFFIVTTGTPATLIWAFFGARALGPEILFLMFMFCIVLFYDTREALMPYVVNGLKLADDCKAKVGRTAFFVIVAIFVGLGVGLPVTLYFQYSNGVDVSLWKIEQAKRPFNETISIMQRLDAQGQLEEAGQVTGIKRFLEASPHRNGLIAFFAAAGLVIGFSFLRLRFTNWPLHPVMFLVWSTYAGDSFAQSFLVGWLIKLLITKYGGMGIYQKCKPIMFGLIAGEMLGGVVPMVVSLIYYITTGGELPKPFAIMPG